MTSVGAGSTRVEVAEGVTVDELALERLRHQLSRAAADVVAIAATEGDLLPGASVHSQSQRLALQPLDDLQPAEVARALVVRAEVACTRSDGLIRPEHGAVLVDGGAFAHAMRPGPRPLLPPTAEARPVFACRPVVLFLGTEPDPEAATWAAEIADALAELEVDARLAVPDPAPACRSTRPCAPGREAVEVLDPDVVVALDAATADRLTDWIPADRRSTTVIAFDPACTGPPVLVSWRIGVAADRLRARIGQDAAPPDVAALVHRLCSGPQSQPPVLRIRMPGSRAGHDDGEPQSLVVITGGVDGPDDRVTGLVESAAAIGHHAIAWPLAITVPAPTLVADLVVLRSVPECEAIHRLIEVRHDAGLPTLIDLGAGDLRFAPDARVTALTDRAERLAVACGRAITTSSVVAALGGPLAVEVLQVATLPPNATLQRLQPSTTSSPDGAPIVGWRIDASHPEIDRVARALRTLLDRRSDLLIQVIGDPTDIPPDLTGHSRVALTPGADDRDTRATWQLQVWTAPIGGFALTGEIVPALDGGAIGMPTVVGATHIAGADDRLRGAVVSVDDAGESTAWVATIERLLDEPALRSDAVQRSQTAVAELADPVGRAESVAALLRWASTPRAVPAEARA